MGNACSPSVNGPARHDEAAGDAEKEAAWRRVVELTERQKALQALAAEPGESVLPVRAVTREQVKAHLNAIGALVAAAQERGQGLVRSLVDHQGLGLQMVDGRTVKVRLVLLPPGAAGEPVGIETALVLSAENRIDLWLAEQNARGLRCACGCGRRLDI